MNPDQKIGIGCAILLLLVIGGCLYYVLRPLPQATTPTGNYSLPTSIPMSQPPTAMPTQTEAYYIGNSRTGKFHRPGCQWAQKISPQNRVIFQSRDQAVAQGYIPCKVCSP